MKKVKYSLVMVMLAVAVTAQADLLTEMTFGTPAANGSSNSVPFDVSPATSTGLLTLRGSGTYKTEILANKTGISRRWDERIRQGYLHVDAFSNVTEANRNLVGTSTSGGMRTYLGQTSGDNIAGTLYMVFRPTAAWTTSNRRTLTGTGGTGWTSMRLWVPNGTNALTFDYTRVNSTAAKSQIMIQNTTWSTNTWYFTAISWQVGQEPRLYLREMSSQGPELSPAASLGAITTTTGFQSTVPYGSNGMPFIRPLTIGAYYYDPGGVAGTVDGAAAHFAYFRLDNGLSTYEQIEDVFNGLAAPEDGTVVIVR